MNYLKTKPLSGHKLRWFLDTFESLCKERKETLHVLCHKYKVNDEIRYKGFKITPLCIQSFWCLGFSHFENVWDLSDNKLTFHWETQDIYENRN